MRRADKGIAALLPQHIPGDGPRGHQESSLKYSLGVRGPSRLVGPSWGGPAMGNAAAEQGGSQHGRDKRHQNKQRRECQVSAVPQDRSRAELVAQDQALRTR